MNTSRVVSALFARDANWSRIIRSKVCSAYSRTLTFRGRGPSGVIFTLEEGEPWCGQAKATASPSAQRYGIA